MNKKEKMEVEKFFDKYLTKNTDVVIIDHDPVFIVLNPTYKMAIKVWENKISPCEYSLEALKSVTANMYPQRELKDFNPKVTHTLVEMKYGNLDRKLSEELIDRLTVLINLAYYGTLILGVKDLTENLENISRYKFFGSTYSNTVDIALRAKRSKYNLNFHIKFHQVHKKLAPVSNLTNLQLKTLNTLNFDEVLKEFIWKEEDNYLQVANYLMYITRMLII